jgi:NTE family protein
MNYRAPLVEDALSPVRPEDERPPSRPVQAGVALCLSGGGYRAMLFHTGALKRLNELGYLPMLDRVSSVSGGSIAAGVLAQAWGDLEFGADGVGAGFDQHILAPVRRLAASTIDVRSVALGLLGWRSIGEQVTRAYNEHLFHGRTPQDLPDRPRFVLNATNMQSGVLWRFSKPYMRDYRVGEVKAPRVSLATAVAASAAFPPFLSPVRLKPTMSDYSPHVDEDLHTKPYMTNVTLTDGGVYDNLGLETAWKRFETVLVSDGGGRLPPDATIPSDWARHGLRAIEIMGSQVGSLRKRQVIDSFKGKVREGTYWGTYTDIANYGLADALVCPHEKTLKLAAIATRLEKVDRTRQERLLNWGYAVCDAAMRTWVVPGTPPPAGFPFPASGIG